MIKVTCAACEASFNAKDELAGRKGRCPSCGEPIVVPEAPAAAPVAGAAPAAAVPSVSRRAPSGGGGASGGSSRGGSRRAKPSPSRSSGRGRSRSKKGGMGGVVVVVVLALGIAAAAFFLQGGGSDGKLDYEVGQMAASNNQWDEAIAAFNRVPQESPLYAQAQAKLVAAQEQKQAAEAAADARAADPLYDLIMSVETHYVTGQADSPNYAPYARYLLKRCREFVQRFPDDPRSAALKQYDFKYAKVASLDKPATEADVDAEITFRCIMPKPNYKVAGAVVDEFALANPDQVDAVKRLRDRMQTSSLEYWASLRDRLKREGELEPGKENWQRIANAAFRYLDSIEGVVGIVPSQEAVTLYTRATDGG